MKKYILIILFIFNSTLLFSQTLYFNYSISKNISDGNINHAIGTDLFIPHYSFLHIPGFRYVFGDNIVNIQYSLIPLDLVITRPIYLLFGIGANISYNINNHIFGVSPEINITSFHSFGVFCFNLAYRYNINFNYNNSHEIGFTIKIMNPWLIRKLLRDGV